VGNEEQERRFEARIEDPLRQWKLSPVDLPSRERWYQYSRAPRDLIAGRHRYGNMLPGILSGPTTRNVLDSTASLIY